MLKGNLKFIIVLTLCLGTLIALQLTAPKPIDWHLSYMKKDKIPYGASALHKSLPFLFPSQKIIEEKKPLYNSLTENNFHHCNYIIINENFSPDTLDVRELLAFVKNGNNAFIAANFFGGKIADTLKLETDNFFDLGNINKNDSVVFANLYEEKDTAEINFVSPHLKNTTSYRYGKGLENTYFTSFDTGKTIILGVNKIQKINYIEIPFGKGKFFLNTIPEAFTNYHFVSKNHDYVYKALSYLPITDVIWDEYYKIGNTSKENPMHVLFNNEALKYAYYLLLISLIIFIVIGIKRKQRIIPVIEPLRNTTLDFVNIVGTLYYQTGNHKNIADKKIIYFLEYIRASFQVKTIIFDDAFILRISNLSGIDRQKIHDLFYYFSEITAKSSITQIELLKLNRTIEEFHRLNKR